jgi:1-pyrroline-5-carboxylate dehydrogenase
VKAAVIQSIRGAFEYQGKPTLLHGPYFKLMPNSGQKCSALSRLYVPESLWPEFKQQLVEQCKNIKMGSPEDSTNFMGPVVSKFSFDKITSYIEKAKKAGGEVIVGGGCEYKFWRTGSS